MLASPLGGWAVGVWTLPPYEYGLVCSRTCVLYAPCVRTNTVQLTLVRTCVSCHCGWRQCRNRLRVGLACGLRQRDPVAAGRPSLLLPCVVSAWGWLECMYSSESSKYMRASSARSEICAFASTVGVGCLTSAPRESLDAVRQRGGGERVDGLVHESASDTQSSLKPELQPCESLAPRCNLSPYRGTYKV